MDQPKYIDYKQRSIERQNALTNAVNFSGSGTDILFVLDCAETFYNWTSKGERPNETK
jgi:hypothetical protein